MMAPRTTIFGSIFTQTKPTLEQTISELRTELHNARATITELKRKLAMAEANIAIFRNNAQRPYIVPTGDAESGYTCGAYGCNCDVSQDYKFCPGCGCEIDWRVWCDVMSERRAYDRRA